MQSQDAATHTVTPPTLAPPRYPPVNGRRAWPREPRPTRSDWLVPPNYKSHNTPRGGGLQLPQCSALLQKGAVQNGGRRGGRAGGGAGGGGGRATEFQGPGEAGLEPLLAPLFPPPPRGAPSCPRPACQAGGQLLAQRHVPGRAPRRLVVLAPGLRLSASASGPRPGGAAGARGGQIRGPRRAWRCARAGGLGALGLCPGEDGVAAPICAPRPATCISNCLTLPRCFSMFMAYSQRGRETVCGKLLV